MGRRLFFMILLIPGMASTLRAQYGVQNAFPHLTFSSPVDLQNAHDGSNRLFAVEQGGRIRVFQNSSAVSSSKIFLDISAKVISGGELGLLGLAFHPDYATNGYFYVNYTSPSPSLHTVIARYRVSATDPDIADPASETILLTYNQPFTNHNGGQLAFGTDGYLYIAAGDGGSGGDPLGNGQNRSVLLGKILRIDVDSTADTLRYAIPPDNPFAGNSSGYRQEIYAYGFRNPWRFSVDQPTGRIWVGDVGQDNREEIDLLNKGGNYGWNKMEGFVGYPDPSVLDTAGLGVVLPVWDYSHASGLGYCVTGGYVYRGNRIPDLLGGYVYGDYGSGRIWSLAYDGAKAPVNMPLVQSGLSISSFGVDEQGELYICDLTTGGIYQLNSLATNSGGDAAVPAKFVLDQNYPNPFNPSTIIPYELAEPAFVTLKVFNLLGQEVATLVQEQEAPGTHTVRFSGSRLSGGMYLYRLQTPQFTETRRMVLLR